MCQHYPVSFSFCFCFRGVEMFPPQASAMTSGLAQPTEGFKARPSQTTSAQWQATTVPSLSLGLQDQRKKSDTHAGSSVSKFCTHTSLRYTKINVECYVSSLHHMGKTQELLGKHQFKQNGQPSNYVLGYSTSRDTIVEIYQALLLFSVHGLCVQFKCTVVSGTSQQQIFYKTLF